MVYVCVLFHRLVACAFVYPYICELLGYVCVHVHICSYVFVVLLVKVGDIPARETGNQDSAVVLSDGSGILPSARLLVKR